MKYEIGDFVSKPVTGICKIENILYLNPQDEKNDKLLKSILGENFTTHVMRCPGGYMSWKGMEPLDKYLDENKLVSIDWNALNEDAQGAAKTAEELVQKTKENIERLGPDADSVVLLMHDTYGKEETVKALPQIIEYLQDKGFEFRTIK